MKTFDEPISVFLVDDDKMFLSSLKHKLAEKFNQEIIIDEFGNGEDCLKKIKEKPDVVVLDYYLNGENREALNGIEILKKIKSEANETHVIMLSAQDKMEVAADSIKHGAYDYVPKSESAFIRTENIIKNIVSNIKWVREGRLFERLNYFMGIAILILIILDVVYYSSR